MQRPDHEEAKNLLSVLNFYPHAPVPAPYGHLTRADLKAQVEAEAERVRQANRGVAAKPPRPPRKRRLVPRGQAQPGKQVAPAPAPAPAPAARRTSAPRLRALFLRRYRECGEVKRAAGHAGVAPSTAYRWRERDAAFRRRWDSIAEQRRQMVEDRLMRLVNEGEKVAVFYKGQQVGWKVSHTPRAAIAMLACLDRRAKEAEKARSVLHSDAPEKPEDDDESEACLESAPRKTATVPVEEERSLAPLGMTEVEDARSVLHSDPPKELEGDDESETCPEPNPRKTGSAFHSSSRPEPSPSSALGAGSARRSGETFSQDSVLRYGEEASPLRACGAPVEHHLAPMTNAQPPPALR